MVKLRHLQSCYLNCQDGEEWHNGFQIDIILYAMKGGDKVTTLWGNCFEAGETWLKDALSDAWLKPWPKDWIFPTKDLLFEDLLVPVPRRYEAIGQ